MTDWLKKAKETGFDVAQSLDPARLETRAAVRDMCAADKCRAYNRNWTCPPACGTLDECAQRMYRYSRGIILQTIGNLTKEIDTRGYTQAMERHTLQFRRFAEEIRSVYPEALCLGAGACTVCAQCAYPEPCRFPKKALSSMEAYGLFVTQVCRDCGVAYFYRPKTITYTACVLY